MTRRASPNASNATCARPPTSEPRSSDPVTAEASAAATAARRAVPAVPALAALIAAGLLLTPWPARADAIRDQQQWALDAVNAPAAWETTRGGGVTVAVLDTGVDPTHPDLAGAIRQGRDMVGMGAGPGDQEWASHGTAMAGIIAGRGHGAGRDSGVMGVAPEAEILPVRVLLEDDDPERDTARETRSGALAEGIRWATDQGADVINLSLGDDSESAHPDPDEDAAVRYALSQGAVVVASAGNGGENGDPVSYPAGYPGVIAVAAVDRGGSPAEFSTERWYATLCAPGKDVIVADPDRDYYTGWGTSAAAAFVSGSAALLLAAHPDLTPAQVRDVLVETAAHPPPGGRDDALGGGMVDPAAAIDAAVGLTARPLAPAAGPYEGEFFGPGPSEGGGGAGRSAWLAPLSGAAGVVLLAAAAALMGGGTARIRERVRRLTAGPDRS
ncbi:type VII secretion-associated serine protease mycosin [Streptomyces radicis]|uniref:Type VII secretion-associated serine protease mycosin n=1 Tax=Streptomyces radicis TaxID=1750517 RepID=A0A3A9WI94_9ACTN|nr:type VII secretion-associated serine protease mycosin [Streptomyces radicis]RKN27490.1 type VII secretion-associated serine protease mycosin [Streptomyces radicis]